MFMSKLHLKKNRSRAIALLPLLIVCLIQSSRE